MLFCCSFCICRIMWCGCLVFCSPKKHGECKCRTGMRIHFSNLSSLFFLLFRSCTLLCGTVFINHCFLSWIYASWLQNLFGLERIEYIIILFFRGSQPNKPVDKNCSRRATHIKEKRRGNDGISFVVSDAQSKGLFNFENCCYLNFCVLHL